jgi:hypothetical protein
VTDYSIRTIWDLYANRQIPVPPYYALHPPVYYSYPVPRPYGYSPFAYPGSVPTPDVLAPQPATILNPFVEPREEGPEIEPSSDQTAGAPQMVLNPFAASPARPNVENLARGE